MARELLPALNPAHIAGAIAVGAQSARIVSELHARQLPVIVLDRFTVPDQTDLAVAIRQFIQPHPASPA